MKIEKLGSSPKEGEGEKNIRKFNSVEEFQKFLFNKEDELQGLNEIKANKKGKASQLIESQIKDLEKGLEPYQTARELVGQIEKKKKDKEENKELRKKHQFNLKAANAYLDKDIVELNSQLEGLVVGEEEEKEKETKEAEREEGAEKPEAEPENILEEVAEEKTKAKEILEEARKRLVEVEVLKKKYEGFKGLFKSREEKGKIEEEYEQMLREYQEAKAEYMEDIAEEKIAITDLRAEQFNKEKGFGKKFYDGYKKLGNYNAEWLLKKTSWGEKFVQKINAKSEGSKLTRLFKGALKGVTKVLLRGLSLRTLISTSLLGIGVLSGGGIGLVGATIGRKIFRGATTAFGTYDLLKIGGEIRQDVWGLGKNLGEKDIKELTTEELVDRMAYFEQRAESSGDNKFLKKPAYEKLGKELSARYAEQKAGKLEGKLDEFIKQADQGLDRIRKKEKRKDTVRKVVAIGVGAIATGVLDKLFGKKEPVSPKPEQAPVPESPPAPEVPPIGYQGGKDIWHEAENQLKARMGAAYGHLDQAQKTYLIDNFKDKIFNNPEQYGLPKSFNADKITPEQLQNIKWGELFRLKNQADLRVFDKMANLTLADKTNILENNRLLLEYATKTRLPIETNNVTGLLARIKEVGGVNQFLAGKTTPEISNVLKKAGESVTRLNELLSQGKDVLAGLGAEAFKGIARNYGFSGTKAELFVEYLKNHMTPEVLKALISKGGEVDPVKMMSRLDDFGDAFSQSIDKVGKVLAAGGRGAVKDAILDWGRDMGLDKSTAKGFFKHAVGMLGKKNALNVLQRDPGKIAEWFVDFKG